MATGSSDLPNQVNNSIVFPGIFRGVLDVGARSITDEMAVAAARALAAYGRERGISEDHILPTMDDPEAAVRVAVAAAVTAQAIGLTPIRMSEAELATAARRRIAEAREALGALVDAGCIRLPGDDRPEAER